MTTIITTIIAIASMLTGIKTEPATVTNYIDDNTLELVTADGESWACMVDDVNEYKVNDTLTITFNTYNNDNIYDDEIINIA